MFILPDEVRAVEWDKETDGLYVFLYNHISVKFPRRKDAPEFIIDHLMHNKPNVINHSRDLWTYYFYERK